ncbi:MAG: phosphotransferase, partial [Calditrichaeota bacterium]|nr:phosphotransferase [Calditrichota bacterium]
MNLIETRPRFNSDEVEKIVEEFFGLHCRAKPLTSYFDQNFHIKCAQGSEFVLKISNGAEKRAALAAQLEMPSLLAEKMPGYQFPTTISTKQNENIFCVKNDRGEKYYARLVQFISGKFLSQIADHSENLLFNFGKFLGQMDRELTDFDRAGLHRELDWDLKNALDSRHRLAYIPDPGKRRLVEYFLLQFEIHVSPELSRLRRSAIHNDANDFNVLVDEIQPEKIKGLIDFGDVVFSNTIFELAIACTYSMFRKSEPLQAAMQVIQG